MKVKIILFTFTGINYGIKERKAKMGNANLEKIENLLRVTVCYSPVAKLNLYGVGSCTPASVRNEVPIVIL